MEVQGPTFINTGPGEDSVRVVDSTFARMFMAHTGADDDHASVFGSKFAGPVILHGGLGEDALKENNNQFQNVFLEDFEL